MTTIRFWMSLCVLALMLLIVGCGREREPNVDADSPPTGSAGPTATSSAILAATPTFTPEIVADADENAQTDQVAGNDAPSSRNGNAGDNAGDNAPAVEASAVEAATADEPIQCKNEIALDLIGHPQYAELQNQLGCPLAEPLLDPVGINEFGPGPEFDRFMLWFSTSTKIYVLKPDRSWQSFADTWADGDAEILCNPSDGEMTSPPLPRRGFGKLWCAEAELQEVMGTISREERLCQHAVVQEFEKGRLLGCFEDATIRYLQILSDGSWDMKFVQ